MDIVHELNIKTSLEKLYKALSSQNGLSGWWAKDCKVGQIEGDHSLMRFNKEGNIVEMQLRIDQLSPNERVAWTSTQNPNPAWINTQLIFEFKQNGNTVDLKFTHGNWDAKWKGEPPYTMTKETWNHFMNSLKSFCETSVGQPW